MSFAIIVAKGFLQNSQLNLSVFHLFLVLFCAEEQDLSVKNAWKVKRPKCIDCEQLQILAGYFLLGLTCKRSTMKRRHWTGLLRLMFYRWNGGRPAPVREGVLVRGGLHLRRVLERAQQRYHQLWQLRARHAHCVPVHHHGGLDWRHVRRKYSVSSWTKSQGIQRTVCFSAALLASWNQKGIQSFHLKEKPNAEVVHGFKACIWVHLRGPEPRIIGDHKQTQSCKAIEVNGSHKVLSARKALSMPRLDCDESH